MPLKRQKVTTPILAIGGEKGLDAKIGTMVEAIAKHVTSQVMDDCGHFIPEEQPAVFVRLFATFAEKSPSDGYLSRRRVITLSALTGATLSSPSLRASVLLESSRPSTKPPAEYRRPTMFESTPQYPPLPPDDKQRNFTCSEPNTDQTLPHIGLVGDTYTITVSGDDTNGRFCVIDMHIPPGGGPAPHRHDFEETFIILEGEIEATFRGNKSIVKAGATVNIPSNAPHQFHNASSKAVRLLCICSPAGQENFPAGRCAGRNPHTSPSKLDKEQQQQFMEKAKALAPKYRTELLKEA